MIKFLKELDWAKAILRGAEHAAEAAKATAAAAAKAAAEKAAAAKAAAEAHARKVAAEAASRAKAAAARAKAKTLRPLARGESGAARDSGAYRGPSQRAPGGQAGPPVSIRQVKQALGRAGMSVRDYDVVHVPKIESPTGPAFGRSPHVNDAPVLGPTGRPLIEISDMGLSSMDDAVTTIFHEIYHHQSYARGAGPGEERVAEAFGQRMLAGFNRRRL